ncbi:MAG: STM4015 family protein [Candidatus Lokiarchaeota archaeon]|nr:STM4015 family protein [Candidatus Lokiarchaeota archaeon]
MMLFGHYLEEFNGRPVRAFIEEFIKNKKEIINPDLVYSISTHYDYDEYNWIDLFSIFLNLPGVEKTTAIIIGCWEEINHAPTQIVEALVAAKNKLPGLRAIFFADIIYEDNELSWINQPDLTPILKAFPNLEYLAIRGSNDLSLAGIEHDNLKTLIIQSAGLDRSVVNQIIEGRLPSLEHLELYLGCSRQGANSTVNDFKDLFFGNLFPNLKYLGLRNSEIADELAKLIANAPILNLIEALDLSLGTLSDKGLESLLNSSLLKNLKKLDIYHHYCSSKLLQRLNQFAKTTGIDVDFSEKLLEERDEDIDWDDDYEEDEGSYRYVAYME